VWRHWTARLAGLDAPAEWQPLVSGREHAWPRATCSTRGRVRLCAAEKKEQFELLPHSVRGVDARAHTTQAPPPIDFESYRKQLPAHKDLVNVFEKAYRSLKFAPYAGAEKARLAEKMQALVRVLRLRWLSVSCCSRPEPVVCSRSKQWRWRLTQRSRLRCWRLSWWR
jgi:hypothetical protein